MNKILKAYLVYFVGAYGLYGLSQALLNTASAKHDQIKAKANGDEPVEICYRWVPLQALDNLREACRLLKDSL